jgi:hypothetical protein
MVYTTDLKSVARKGLRVQVPPLAPTINDIEKYNDFFVVD